MIKTSSMTPEQRFLFDIQGYLVIENALNSSEIDSLKESALRLAHEKASDPSEWDDRGEPRRTIRVHHIIEKDQNFLNMIDHPSTVGIIQELTGGSPILIDNDVELTPHTTNLQGWHWGVDPAYGYYAGEGRQFCLMVKAIFYLTDVNIGECPTRIVPGSHKARIPAPIPSDGVSSFPGAVELQVKAGTAFIFSEALIHAGNKNDSTKTRINFYLNYGPSFVQPWESYRPSAALRDQAEGLRKQLLGGGKVYVNSEEQAREIYK